ncbi:MAG: hypothetical protein Q9223_003871 [Gallowayella weberi]
MSQEDDSNPVVLHKPEPAYLSLIVPKKEVKNIKTALEAHSLLDKTSKISHAVLDTRPVQPCEGTAWVTIPTVFEVDHTDHENDHIEAITARDALLERIDYTNQTGFEIFVKSHRRLDDDYSKNPLMIAIHEWLKSLRDRGVALPKIPDKTTDKYRWTYTVYSPMILLPSNFLVKEPWCQLLAPPLQLYLHELWCIVCQKVKVSYIAINKPIPALLPNKPANSTRDILKSNILRSPSDLTPVHGDFGEPNLPPTNENFQRALWVSTVQNDISQEWAPMYTMFSRGNISEKTRLLNLLSTASTSGTRKPLRKPSKYTAVDLYAGIGYFAFSYAKAGAEKILCWELNGWSIEGLKRGAKKNGWTVKVVDNEKDEKTLRDEDQEAKETANERLLVFHESNSNAATRVETLRDRLPPVRHVNCGYLPSSSGSWEVAVKVLDPVEGGWIHAHENVATQDIKRRKGEVLELFKDLVSQCYNAGSGAYRFNVECQHVERVKAYAPGVMHCVFDIELSSDEH